MRAPVLALALSALSLAPLVLSTASSAQADPTPSLCPAAASPEAAQAWLRDLRTDSDGSDFTGPTLDLDGVAIKRALTYDDVPFLIGLPNVQTLMLRLWPHDEALLARLGCLPKLRTVAFQKSGITPAKARLLATGLATIGLPLSLAFADESMGDEGLVAIASIPTLESLTLDGVGVRNGSWLNSLRNSATLKRLAWSSTPGPGKPALDTLARCNLSALADTSLESLSLAGLGVEDGDLAALGSIRTLRSLALPSNALKGCVAPLAVARNLQRLDLRTNALTPACIADLSELPSLKRVTLEDTTLKLEDIRAAAAELPNLTTVFMSDPEAESAFLASFAGRTPPLCVQNVDGERACSE